MNTGAEERSPSHGFAHFKEFYKNLHITLEQYNLLLQFSAF